MTERMSGGKGGDIGSNSRAFRFNLVTLRLVSRLMVSQRERTVLRGSSAEDGCGGGGTSPCADEEPSLSLEEAPRYVSWSSVEAQSETSAHLSASLKVGSASLQVGSASMQPGLLTGFHERGTDVLRLVSSTSVSSEKAKKVFLIVNATAMSNDEK